MPNHFLKEFTEQSSYRNEENAKRITKCLHAIDEAEIWKSPNEHSNSVANLILHLCGNIRQYIISALGNEEDERERDTEFSIKEGYNKSELISKINSTVTKANEIIKNISDDDLNRMYRVQGFNLSGIGIIIHVTEHLTYHPGQIAYRVKQIKNKDLGFYADIDLNVKSKN